MYAYPNTVHYIQQIKPIFVNGSQGDYGLPFSFNGKFIKPLPIQYSVKGWQILAKVCVC